MKKKVHFPFVFLSSSFPSFLPFFYYLIDSPPPPVHSEPFYADRHCDAPGLHLAEQEARVLPWGLSPVGGQTGTWGGAVFRCVTPEGLSLGRQAAGLGAGAGLGGAWAEVGGRAELEDPGFYPQCSRTSAGGSEAGAM